MRKAAAILSDLGFDGPRLNFTIRTALAACLALSLACLMGLEHPQWSAMTVWAASQPTRGQLVEKSLFRVAGTLSGVFAGIVLVTVSVDRPVVLVGGLAVWTALCAGIGNVQRGFVAYGTILAGYSAAMVALLDVGQPAAHVFDLGADRLLTVLTGVVTAFVIGWLFTPRDAVAPLASRIRLLTARVMRDLATPPAERSGLDDELRAILLEMAEIDDMLDPHLAGTLRSRRRGRLIRTLLAAEISGLLWLRSPDATQVDDGTRAALLGIARAIEADASPEAVLVSMREAVGTVADSALRDVLGRMKNALEAYSDADIRADPAPARQPVILHRDWAGGWQAMIRTLIAMLAVGGLWLATGLSSGPFMLLGLAVMTSLFSTFDNPALTMRTVFLGQVLGSVGVLACRWLVWPYASDRMEMIILVMPFILAGAFILAHRRTAPIGFDYNMVLLLLLQPTYPLSGEFSHWLATVAAVVSAPIAAFVAYKLIYPVDGQVRMNMLIGAMVHELQDMAARPQTAGSSVWRARFYHRLLRLVRWAEKTGAGDLSVVGSALAVLNVGSAMRRMHEMLAVPSMPLSIHRRFAIAFARSRDIAKNPEQAGQAFARAASALRRQHRPEAGLLDSAAADIAANLGFFRRAATQAPPSVVAGRLAGFQGVRLARFARRRKR